MWKSFLISVLKEAVLEIIKLAEEKKANSGEAK